MNDDRRTVIIDRIAERLTRFDEFALHELDRLTDAATYADGATTEPASPVDDQAEPSRAISRRQLVTGGALVTASAVTTAFALSGGRGGAGIARASELDGLRRLTALHRKLESLGLDDRLRAALATVAAAFSVVRSVASILAAGIDLIDDAARVFEQAIEPLEAGLQRMAGVAEGLSIRLTLLAGALQATAGSVVEAVGQFVDGILDRLPFGFAEDARAALEAVRDVLGLAPDAVAAADEGLIAPLRELWLPEADSGEPGLRGRLLDPLRNDLLTPARNLLRALSGWQTAWSDEIEGAVDQLLGERAVLRDEIVTLETELGLVAPGEAA